LLEKHIPKSEFWMKGIMNKQADCAAPAQWQWALPVGLLVCLLVSYLPIIQKLVGRWEGGDNSYCYLIVPFFAYLCWEMRESFKFSIFSLNLMGLLFFLFSSTLIVLGELGSIETLSYLGLWVAAVGLLATMYGTRVKALLFPLAILFFIIPLPPFINKLLTFRLRLWASALAAQLLRLFDIPVLQEGNILDLGVAKLQVADACSGLRYLMPMFFLALLLGFYLLGNRRAFRVGLLLFVVPFSIFVNGARVFGMGIFESNGSSVLTEGFWHDFTGWMVFMVSGVALAGVALGMRKLAPAASAAGKAGDEVAGSKKFKTQAASLTAYLATAAACAIILGSGWAAARIPHLQKKVSRSTFRSFPMQIGRWEGRSQIIGEKILASLWADDYVSATYTTPGSQAKVLLLIPYYSYQSTQHTAHAPQSCLLGGGWSILQTVDREVRVDGDKTITVRSMEMKKDDSSMLATYFFLQRGRVLVSPWTNKFYLMWDAATKRRTDGALVRVEIAVPPGAPMSSANEILDEYLKALWPVLSGYIPGDST